MNMISVIRDAWSWIGLEPLEVISSNLFGNVIVLDKDGKYWRICPEELCCQVVAHSNLEYERLLSDPGFLADWEMAALVRTALENFGPLAPDGCYCLKVPAVLGGEYHLENLGTNSRIEVIAFSGDVAEQIRDIPDGGEVDLRVVR